MAVTPRLEAAIANLRAQGHDPAKLRGDNYVLAFSGILRRGARTWNSVAAAVAATPPDFEAAGELLRTNRTFENSGGPEIRSFEQDIRIAGDSSALGLRSPGDSFLLTVGPLRRALYQAEQAPATAVRAARSSAGKLAKLPGAAAALRGRADDARTSWGTRRLRRRAERLDARAAGLEAAGAERIERAQHEVAAFVADVALLIALFDTTFGVADTDG